MKKYEIIDAAIICLVLSSLAMTNKLVAAPDGDRLAQAQSTPKTMCAQVISCGTKNGKVKEYPTPCDARGDGATNFHPKTGTSCDAAK
jgi:hypothetical protein